MKMVFLHPWCPLQHTLPATMTADGVPPPSVMSAAEQPDDEDDDATKPEDDDGGVVTVQIKGKQHRKDYGCRLQQHLKKCFGVTTVKVTQRNGTEVVAHFIPPLSRDKIKQAKGEIKAFR
eukprot:PhF_6_TR35214/c0_g1_i1/m.51270